MRSERSTPELHPRVMLDRGFNYFFLGPICRCRPSPSAGSNALSKSIVTEVDTSNKIKQTLHRLHHMMRTSPKT